MNECYPKKYEYPKVPASDEHVQNAPKKISINTDSPAQQCTAQAAEHSTPQLNRNNANDKTGSGWIHPGNLTHPGTLG